MDLKIRYVVKLFLCLVIQQRDGKGSCGEFNTQLMLAKEIGYLFKGDADITIVEAEKTSKMLGGFMNEFKN